LPMLDRRLWLPIDRYRGLDLQCGRVDAGDGLRAPVEGPDLLGGDYIQERIRILSGLDLLGDLERLQVEDDQLVRLPRGREAALQFVDSDGSVRSWDAVDLSDLLHLLQIDDVDLRRMGDEQTAAGRIDRDVVERGTPIEQNLLLQMQARRLILR